MRHIETMIEQSVGRRTLARAKDCCPDDYSTVVVSRVSAARAAWDLADKWQRTFNLDLAKRTITHGDRWIGVRAQRNAADRMEIYVTLEMINEAPIDIGTEAFEIFPSEALQLQVELIR